MPATVHNLFKPRVAHPAPALRHLLAAQLRRMADDCELPSAPPLWLMGQMTVLTRLWEKVMRRGGHDLR